MKNENENYFEPKNSIKFITEMPVTVPNFETPEINNQHLSNYYDSLKTLVDKYKEAPENTNP